jgi:RNA recognition motif-containing protein
MNSDKKYIFEGKKMTGKEIASFLNHKYGGVEFAKGGKIDYACACKSRYYHGGELPSAKLDSLVGGEAVVTVKTMESKDKYHFGSKMMTPRQILSKINAEYSGKKFEEGGTIDFSDMDFQTDKQITKMVFFTEKILYL